MTTHDVENMCKTVETMMRTAQQSIRVVTNYVVQVQALNTRFAQRVFETWIDASCRQTELGQTMAQRLFGKAEEQTNAFQSLLGSWADAYAGFFFGPFGYYREGLENGAHNVTRMPTVTPTTAGGARNDGLPVEDYDEINTGEISGWLDNLSEGSSRGSAITRSATRTASLSSSSSTENQGRLVT